MDLAGTAVSQTHLGAEEGELSGFLGYNLKRVLSIVQSDLARVLAEFELRAVSFSALLVVVQEAGINQTQLAEALKIERSNLVQIIDELANRKLIQRDTVPGDRRRYALVPTAAGRRLLEQARAAVQAHETAVFECLSQNERDTLQQILLKLRGAWAEKSAEQA
jgi:DNA-binding MarR family transcriptional regulator